MTQKSISFYRDANTVILELRARKRDYFIDFLCGAIILAIAFLHLILVAQSITEVLKDLGMLLVSFSFFLLGMITKLARMTIIASIHSIEPVKKGIILQNKVFFSRITHFPLNKSLKVILREVYPKKTVSNFTIESDDKEFHAEIYEYMRMQDALVVKDFLEKKLWNHSLESFHEAFIKSKKVKVKDNKKSVRNSFKKPKFSELDSATWRQS